MPPHASSVERTPGTTATTSHPATRSPGTDRAPGPVTEELSFEAAADLIARAALGQGLAEEERTALRTSLERMSNDQFLTIVRLLDDLHLLMPLMQELFGTENRTGATDEVEIPVLCFRFWNAANRVDADVERANTIYNVHGIYIRATTSRTIERPEAERVVGHPVSDTFSLDRTYSPDASAGGQARFTHADMQAVVREYVPTTVISGLWAKRVLNESGADLSGTSGPEFVFGAGYHKLAAVATDHAGADTFAHELGHVLTNEGHFPSGDPTNLMTTGTDRDKSAVGPDRLTAEQLQRIRASTLLWVRRAGAPVGDFPAPRGDTAYA